MSATRDRAMARWFVAGTPAPQGSKKLVGPYRMVESSKAVAPWRQAVAWTCHTNPVGQFTGPVAVNLVFNLRRPKSAPRRVVWPATRPDIDKLARATLDGIGDSGAVWRDDGQVVRLVATKNYTTGITGALITVTALDVPVPVAQPRTARELLEYVYVLRWYGEGAPGGVESWEMFDLALDRFLHGGEEVA